MGDDFWNTKPTMVTPITHSGANISYVSDASYSDLYGADRAINQLAKYSYPSCIPEPEPSTDEMVDKIVELNKYQEEKTPEVIATLYGKILATQPVWDSVLSVAPILIVHDAVRKSTFYMRKVSEGPLEFSNTKEFDTSLSSHWFAAISLLILLTSVVAYISSLVGIGAWLPATVFAGVALALAQAAYEERRNKSSTITLEDIAFGKLALTDASRIELLSLILTCLERKIKSYYRTLETTVDEYKDHLILKGVV